MGDHPQQQHSRCLVNRYHFHALPSSPTKIDFLRRCRQRLCFTQQARSKLDRGRKSALPSTDVSPLQARTLYGSLTSRASTLECPSTAHRLISMDRQCPLPTMRHSGPRPRKGATRGRQHPPRSSSIRARGPEFGTMIRKTRAADVS